MNSVVFEVRRRLAKAPRPAFVAALLRDDGTVIDIVPAVDNKSIEAAAGRRRARKAVIVAFLENVSQEKLREIVLRYNGLMLETEFYAIVQDRPTYYTVARLKKKAG
ncbi:hypothetical protein [Thermosediminibacter litoriperuensis]|uniref:Uncharacterized protein n=1 Tax=Thermosediminibacter litoriperuensis TaxID=291989 RepID=A0A5S5AQC2_9FIRM|nr:hypothetical protein [Thermosediminibacter litoriperuensis]TYP54233.1 hypothetical protein LZ11_01443 [Thermosediminibacter litoriperuensis]